MSYQLNFKGACLVHLKGEYQNRMDHKARVCLPARLRAALISPDAGEQLHGFTLLKGLDPCLYLYADDQWEMVAERLNRINSFSASGRKVLRRFLRSAEDIQLDPQHRLSVSARLREWAGLQPGGNVIFIGSGNRIEIWSPEHLAADDETLDLNTYQQLFEDLMGDSEPPLSS